MKPRSRTAAAGPEPLVEEEMTYDAFPKGRRVAPLSRKPAWLATLGSIALAGCEPAPSPEPTIEQPVDVSLESQALNAKPSARQVLAGLPDESLVLREHAGQSEIMVEVTRAKPASMAATTCFQSAGLRMVASAGLKATGWVPVAQLDTLEEHPCISGVRLLGKALTDSEPTSSFPNGDTGTPNQAVQAHGVDRVRAKYKVDGQGVHVCIISSSFDLKNGFASGVAAGELPGPGNPLYPQAINVLQEGDAIFFPPVFVDEGRAMAELVHDIAPGARISFVGFAGGDGANFVAAAVDKLRAETDCDIIVDDVASNDISPFFQDDANVESIEAAVKDGIFYVSSAGNSGLGGRSRGSNARYYSAPFRPVSALGGIFHDFDPDPNNVAVLVPLEFNNSASSTDPASTLMRLALQWDEPWGSLCDECAGISRNLRFLILRRRPGEASFTFFTAGGSYNGLDALAFFRQSLDPSAEYLIGLFQASADGPPPSYLKFALSSPSVRIPSLTFEGPTIWSRAAAPSAVSVGSASWFNTPLGAAHWNATLGGQPIEGGFVSFAPLPERPILSHEGGPSLVFRSDSGETLITTSSVGGDPIFFDTLGNRLSEAEVRQKPDLVGADGVETTFFGVRTRRIVKNFFFGTSASGPNVAAIAALALQASNKSLSPSMLKSLLIEHAIDMDNPFDQALQSSIDDPAFARGFDYASGHGFVDAETTVDAVVQAQDVNGMDLAPVCERTDGAHLWSVTNPNGFAVSGTFVTASGLEFPVSQGEAAGGPDWLVPPGRSTFLTRPLNPRSESLRLFAEGTRATFTKRGGWSRCP